MKNNIKGILMVLGIAFLTLSSFYGWLGYETRYKITFIGREESPDGTAAVIFQMRGEPVKSPLDRSPYPAFTDGRFIVEKDGEKIKTEDFSVFNWGDPLQESNWDVHFYPAGVQILLVHFYPETWEKGIEQKLEAESPNKSYQELGIIVYYDAPDIYMSDVQNGERIFRGYYDEVVISEVTARYDDKVSYLRKENDKYYFQADGFEFYANNDFWMSDNYEEAYFNYLAQQFSYEHNRYTYFEKDREYIRYDHFYRECYVPIIGAHGRGAGVVESFSNACCDLVEELQETVGFQKIGYFEDDRRRYFDITPYLENYDRTEFYNAIYRSMEQDSLEEWQYDENERDGNSPEASSGAPPAEILEEMPEEWKNYKTDCFYQKKDGTELRMVGVDRAAGSSYYVLIEAQDGVNTSVINRDPYLGSGGGAKWLDFLEDEKIGFSCLAYSGGSLGSLYRTEDGGKSFEETTWPSANRELPDGTLYNPFIMPEKIWEENGKVYMLVGQGPDGDYYEDGVWAYGLYESENMGRNWTYVGTQEGKDYRR